MDLLSKTFTAQDNFNKANCPNRKNMHVENKQHPFLYSENIPEDLGLWAFSFGAVVGNSGPLFTSESEKSTGHPCPGTVNPMYCKSLRFPICKTRLVKGLWTPDELKNNKNM